MPEGDTIHKLARVMRPQLLGRRLHRVHVRDRGSLAAMRNKVVEEVVPIGKHLLLAVEGGWVVHVHLGMHGAWHHYQRGQTWLRAASTAMLSMESGPDVFVCFDAKCVEVLRRIQLRLHPALSRLGPDLLANAFDGPRVVARARALEQAQTHIAALLLDQRVACGIGNVYKSEILFLERVHPWSLVSELTDATVCALYRRARVLMQRNLGGGQRNTVKAMTDADRAAGQSAPRLWVYERAEEPCLQCRNPIRGALQGDESRATFWCSSCQPAVHGKVISAHTELG